MSSQIWLETFIFNLRSKKPTQDLFLRFYPFFSFPADNETHNCYNLKEEQLYHIIYKNLLNLIYEICKIFRNIFKKIFTETEKKLYD